MHPTRLLLALASVGIILIGFEWYVAHFHPQETFSVRYARAIDCLQDDPRQPYSLRPESTCIMYNEREFDTTATINEHGMRQTGDTHREGDHTRTILLLGDSHTFGYGVSDDETFATKLETLVNTDEPTEILNAGYAAGYSVDSAYAYLTHHIDTLDPDMIIAVITVFNDIEDLAETSWDRIDPDGLPTVVSSKVAYIDEGISRHRSTDIAYTVPLLRDSHVFQLIIAFLRNTVKIIPPERVYGTKRDTYENCSLLPTCIDRFADEEEKFYNVLVGMHRITNERQIPLLVVLIPFQHQLYQDDLTSRDDIATLELPDPTFLQNRIANALSGKGITILDLYHYFDDHRDLGYPFFVTDGHLNATGHSLTAQGIHDYIASEMKIIDTNHVEN